MLSVVLVIPDQDPDLRVIPVGIRAQDHAQVHHGVVQVVVEVQVAMEAVQDPQEKIAEAVVTADHQCPIVDDTLVAEKHLKLPTVLAFLG